MQFFDSRTIALCLLAALLGATAMADDDHGDTAASATALTLGVPMSGRIDPRDDVDYFSLELAEAADVVFTTTGALDTYGALYDSDEQLIASNYDSGAGLNFRIRRELAAGTYYLRVSTERSFFAPTTGNYGVSAAVAAPDDHGDDRGTATDLELGTSIASYLDPGDVDYFRVGVQETTGAVFTTTGELDLRARLYDEDGGRLAYDGDSGDGENFRIRVRLDPGTYFLEVSSAWQSVEGDYEMWAIADEWASPVCVGYGARMAPLVPAAGWPDGLQGFVRMVNREDRRGFFEFEAIDDSGNSYDLAMLLEPYESLHINSEDLEFGNVAKGRLLGTGAAPATGHWRLCMRGDSVDMSAYVRTRDGFLTAMNGFVVERDPYRECPFLGDAPARSSDCRYWKVPLFNPARNVNQASSLRIANNSGEAQRVWIVGYRRDGERNREGGEPLVASGTVPARTAVAITAPQLETGAGLPLEDASGRIGPSLGKWDLEVWAGENADLVIANLMRTPTGHLTNLSSAVYQSYAYRGVSTSDVRVARLKAAMEAKERGMVQTDRERVRLLGRLASEPAR